jgi:hypothetical protein
MRLRGHSSRPRGCWVASARTPRVRADAGLRPCGRWRGGGEGRGWEVREGTNASARTQLTSARTLGGIRADAVFTTSAGGKNPSADKTASAG